MDSAGEQCAVALYTLSEADCARLLDGGGDAGRTLHVLDPVLKAVRLTPAEGGGDAVAYRSVQVLRQDGLLVDGRVAPGGSRGPQLSVRAFDR